MANLHTRIVIRTKGPRRSWVVADGKNDPAGSYYIRHCVGSTPKYVHAGATYEEAELAQIRLERKLKATSIGAVILEEVDTKKSHRIPDVIAAYLADLRLNRRPERSINSKKTDLNEFAQFCGKTYIEQINRTDILNYRNSLLDAGKAPVTALNKMMTIVTWLKKNPIISITGLLKQEDWPEKRDTEPNPYTDAELRAMMVYATPDERLLLRFFLSTGCREQEVAHVEWSDVDWNRKTIQIQAKPHYGWTPKTSAGTRRIPLGDALLNDLKAREGRGLIFPNPNTGRPEGHFLRIIQDIAERAEVIGATCHRWRDTFATTMVRSRVLDLRDVARLMGHTDLSTIKLYAAFCDLESDQAREAANLGDQFAPGPQLVKAG